MQEAVVKTPLPEKYKPNKIEGQRDSPVNIEFLKNIAAVSKSGDPDGLITLCGEEKAINLVPIYPFLKDGDPTTVKFLLPLLICKN